MPIARFCTRAPEGWQCGRQEGHTGPCAAPPMVRIEDARLAELSQLVCGQTHYEGFQCHICERREMARELIEQRALTERLRKALEEASDEFDHLIHEGMSFDPDFLKEICAALAEARGRRSEI